MVPYNKLALDLSFCRFNSLHIRSEGAFEFANERTLKANSAKFLKIYIPSSLTIFLTRAQKMSAFILLLNILVYCMLVN